MPSIDASVLLGAALLLAAIFSSKLSARVGIPTLVIFMGVGMLAGEDGPLGIAFDDFGLAHGAGTLALSFILFDGGLRTPLASVRLAWRPALALSTLGVVLTAGLTGAFASAFLGLSLPVGLLLGSIVGSTDAAAVFAVLRGQGLHLRDRIAATLEVDSGSNDPMAVLLTVGLVSYLMGDLEPGWPVVGLFMRQALVGVAGGLAVGWLGRALVNRVRLDAAGLYPALTLGVALLAYGLPAYLGGSGFLAVYLAGILMGNGHLVFKQGLMRAHDGVAWLAQIVMFVMLGLLATPSRIADLASTGALVAGTLIFAARPAAVFLTLAPFGFSARELLFLSWAGLKGAIPIVLATYPLLAGVPGALGVFDVVFFVCRRFSRAGVSLGWPPGWACGRPGRPRPPSPSKSRPCGTWTATSSTIWSSRPPSRQGDRFVTSLSRTEPSLPWWSATRRSSRPGAPPGSRPATTCSWCSGRRYAPSSTGCSLPDPRLRRAEWSGWPSLWPPARRSATWRNTTACTWIPWRSAPWRT